MLSSNHVVKMPRGTLKAHFKSGRLEGVATIQQVTSASALPSFQTRFEFMQGHC